MEGGREDNYSVGRQAWQVCRRNPGPLCCLGLFHFVSRGALVLLLCMCLWAGAEESFAPFLYVFLAIGAAMFVLFLLPARFFFGERMQAMAAGEKPGKFRQGYGLLLKAGLLKAGRGLLWGLPFLAGLSLFLYGMEYLPYTELGRILQKFVLFGEVTNARGLIAVALLLAVLLLVFALGWRRDMAMEYLPVRRLGIKGMCRLTAKARQRGRGDLMANTCVNFLLALPAAAGCAAVLLPYLQENVRSSGNVLRTVQSFLQLLREPLPPDRLLMLLAVAAVLYIPFFLYRKMRNAVLVQELTREWDGGEDSHAA